MTETTNYLGNHPKIHLQLSGTQLRLRPRVPDRPFSEAGKFEKPSYPVLARFGSLFACIVFVQSGYHTFCQWSGQELFFAQKPVWPRRKQASSRVSSVSNVLSGLDQCCQDMSHVNRILSYLNVIFYSSLKCLKITYLCGIQSLCI